MSQIDGYSEEVNDRKKNFHTLISNLFEDTKKEFKEFMYKIDLSREKVDISVSNPKIVIYESKNIFDLPAYELISKTIRLPSYLVKMFKDGNIQAKVRIKEEIVHHILADLNPYFKEEYLVSDSLKKEILNIVYEALTNSTLYFLSKKRERKIIYHLKSEFIIEDENTFKEIFSQFVSYSKKDKKKLNFIIKEIIRYFIEKEENRYDLEEKKAFPCINTTENFLQTC